MWIARVFALQLFLAAVTASAAWKRGESGLRREIQGDGEIAESSALSQRASSLNRLELDESIGSFALKELQGLLQNKIEQPDHDQKWAYVVFLTQVDDKIIEDVMVLRHSLVQVASPRSKYATGKAKFVAAVTSNLSPHKECLMKAGFDEVIEVPLVNPCPSRDLWLGPIFTRLNAWNLTQFDRVVTLDCDMVVLQNIEELFLHNTLALCSEFPRGSLQGTCKCETPACKGFVDGVVGGFDYTKDPHYINSGLMVIPPNQDQFRKISNYLTKWNLMHDGGYDADSCQPSEQRFIGDMLNDGDKYVPLAAETYNVRLVLMQSMPHLVTNPKVIHYMGAKPQEQATEVHSSWVEGNSFEKWHWRPWFLLRKQISDPPAQCQAAYKIPVPKMTVEIADYLNKLSPEDRAKRDAKCSN